MIEDNWTAVREAGPPATLEGENGRSLLRAIEAFEEFYRTSPGEFVQLSAADSLPPEARRALASLLALSAPAREALIAVLTLPDDIRALVVRVLDLPAEARDALRALIS